MILAVRQEVPHLTQNDAESSIWKNSTPATILITWDAKAFLLTIWNNGMLAMIAGGVVTIQQDHVCFTTMMAVPALPIGCALLCST